MMRKVEDLQLDETAHTSHNDYGQLILKHRFVIANSKYELSDHQMQIKSMDIHDEKLLYGCSQDDPTVEIDISFACSSIPKIY